MKRGQALEELNEMRGVKAHETGGGGGESGDQGSFLPPPVFALRGACMVVDCRVKIHG